MSEHPSHIPDGAALDGNAAAGAFEEIFGIDVTTVTVTCGGCRASAPFAEIRAFLGGPGTVLRCPGCDQVVARVVQTRSETWLEMSGTASWRIPAGADGATAGQSAASAGPPAL